MKKISLLALIAGLVAVPAFAGDAYVLGSIGQSSFDLNKGGLDGVLTTAGLGGISSSLNKTDTGYKAQVGYQFNENFAVEGGYIDFGKFAYSSTFTGGSGNFDYKLTGFNVAAIGILPINDAFSVFGKLGAINAKVDASSSISIVGIPVSITGQATKLVPSWGLGATYNLNKQFAVRAEFEQFGKVGDEPSKGNINLASAGVVFKF